MMQWGWNTKGNSVDALMMVFAAYLSPVNISRYLPIYSVNHGKYFMDIKTARWTITTPVSYNTSNDATFEY